MPKKFLITLGILLLIGAGLYGVLVFKERHGKKQLIVANKNAGDATPASGEDTSSPSQKPTFDKTAHSTSDPTSPWVVVNKKHPLNPMKYVPADLTDAGGSQQMRAEAASALSQTIAAAKAQGLAITPLSGYRSYDTQVGVYANEVKAFGQAVADTESARPGYSEHQSGWGVDVGGGGCGIEDCFAGTAEGKWLAANAYKYGFIIRYPADKTAVTGYRYEPWHIRYVGTDLSQEMNKQNITTLEEFFGISGGGYAG